MRIKLIKPLVQIGRVVPAGTILSDAPPSFMERLVRTGKAEIVTDTPKTAPEASPEKTSLEYGEPSRDAQRPAQAAGRGKREAKRA